ncbi:hypothetical protein GCM10011594_28810 [Nakamurella endophytica]|uniref:Uncharacterized protein n=1 Tax=Nakamurella endophytica TaxID=1748367 RepID=A0A917T2Q9_9ACTN|nr:hypothetical protein GCM10011594_28810 [Nakamurella endophytica]
MSDHVVPQGGGDPDHGHRCPGEGVPMSRLTVTTLAGWPHRLAPQGLTADLGRMPTRPASGVVLLPE